MKVISVMVEHRTVIIREVLVPNVVINQGQRPSCIYKYGLFHTAILDHTPTHLSFDAFATFFLFSLFSNKCNLVHTPSISLFHWVVVYCREKLLMGGLKYMGGEATKKNSGEGFVGEMDGFI